MNVVILNGNPDERNIKFERFLSGYQVKLHNTDHYVRMYNLRDMKIEDYPDILPYPEGNTYQIAADDDTRYIRKSIAEADLVVWASPIYRGYISGLMKKVQDRLIPTMLGQNETKAVKLHARKRMGKIPLFGVIVQKEKDTDYEDLLINKMTQEKLALDLHSALRFFVDMDETVCDAVCLTFQSLGKVVFAGEETNTKQMPVRQYLS